MSGVIDEGVCPQCGETYTYEFDTRSWEFSKLTACRCDRVVDYYIEFIKRKGLEQEFEEFKKEKEKEHWREWISERVEEAIDLEELIEKLKANEDNILGCMSADDILDAVAEGLADYDREEVEELVNFLTGWLNISPELVKRKILAGIL